MLGSASAAACAAATVGSGCAASLPDEAGLSPPSPEAYAAEPAARKATATSRQSTTIRGLTRFMQLSSS